MDNRTMLMSAPFHLHTAGREIFPAHKVIPVTKHGIYTLRLLTKGVFRHIDSDGERSIAAPRFGLFGPDSQGVLAGDPGAPPDYCYLRFCGPYAIQMAERIRSMRGEWFSPEGGLAETLREMRQCAAQLRLRKMASMTDIDMLDLKLAGILCRLMPLERQTTATAVTGESLLEYLREHLQEPTRLDAIAEHFGVSRATLSRAARRCFGQSVLQLHEEMKIAWAEELLRLGRLPVHQIAASVGFDDPFYFSRVFKKHRGVSPKNWESSASLAVADSRCPHRPPDRMCDQVQSKRPFDP